MYAVENKTKSNRKVSNNTILKSVKNPNCTIDTGNEGKLLRACFSVVMLYRLRIKPADRGIRISVRFLRGRKRKVKEGKRRKRREGRKEVDRGFM
jgi:GT2 family glycosyltransferase